jgi:hypothetical protein
MSMQQQQWSANALSIEFGLDREPWRNAYKMSDQCQKGVSVNGLKKGGY